MATATNDMFKSLRDAAITAWDWPLVPGAGYDTSDRRRLRTLSQSFSAVAGTATAALSVANHHSVGHTVGLAAVGVVAGHYAAGVVMNIWRRARDRQSPSGP